MKLKLIKGLSIITLGLLFLSVKFYNIVSIVDIYTTKFDAWGLFVSISQFSRDVFNEVFDGFFQTTGMNVPIGLLFIFVGLLEILEIKGVKKDGN